MCRSMFLQETIGPATVPWVRQPPCHMQQSLGVAAETAARKTSGFSSGTSQSGRGQSQTRLKDKPIALAVVAANRQQFCDLALAIDSRDVHDHLNRECNCLTDAPVRQPHIGCQNTVRQSSQCLF